MEIINLLLLLFLAFAIPVSMLIAWCIERYSLDYKLRSLIGRVF
jgi:hypothetical protein